MSRNNALRIFQNWLNTGGRTMVERKSILEKIGKLQKNIRKRKRPNTNNVNKTGLPLNRFPYKRYSQLNVMRRFGKKYGTPRISTNFRGYK